MSKIACIGWGSLIWEPKNLPIFPKWFPNGPQAPVEFLRKSRDGRITLVLHERAQPIQTLWAMMKCTDLSKAKLALCEREGTNVDKIDFCGFGQCSSSGIPGISDWILSMGLDAAIWTGLKPKFDGSNDPPSLKQVISYLTSLDGKSRALAEQYIRKTPRQVNTEYRRHIQAHFNWTPIDSWGDPNK